MAQITFNKPIDPHRVPNMAPEATEMGDTWNTVLNNLNAMFTELYGGISTIGGNKTYTGTAAFQGAVTIVPGGAATSNAGKPVLDLSTNVSQFTSANTNTSQTMFTYSLPPSTLQNANQGLYVETWGAVANNAASKSIALNVGGKTLSSGSFTSANVAWSLDAYYMKTGANAQNWLAEGWAGTTRVASTSATDTTVDTSTITITVVATDASAATGNVLGNGLLVQFLP